MNVPRQMMSVLMAGSLVLLAACGGDDEPVLDPATGQATATDTATAAATGSGDTAATDDTAGSSSADAQSDLPESVRVASRPVEVIGDPLPAEVEDGGPDPAIGMMAPVLVGEDFDGRSVRVDAASSGPTMVVFFAHWCAHCNREVPRIVELRNEGAFPDGLRIVGVSTGYNPQYPNFPPDEWLQQMGWEDPVIADQLDLSNPSQPLYVAGDAFGLGGYPYVVLIDSDGTVAARWSGERGDEIINLIESAGLDL